VDGAGAYFEGMLRHFTEARSAREWIVVAPHAISSSEEVLFDRYRPYGEKLVREWNGRRLEFDEPGVLGLLAFLSEHFGAARKVNVTAYAQGARLAYRLAFRHPDRLAQVVLTCPTFEAALADGPTPATGGGPAVVALVAEQDPARAALEAGADAAAAALAKTGVASVTRRAVPGVLCSDLPQEVWAIVAP
jgi:pimeloyl-ACP methyl ester carboxylesterase